MNSTQSYFKDLTLKQRSHIGQMVYVDSYNREFKYARELVSGIADTEIRIGLFDVIFERLPDMNSLEDAGYIFGEVTNSMLKEAKDWASEHLMKTAQALMPFIDQEMISLMTSLMGRPKVPTALQWRDERFEQRKQQAEADRVAQEHREQFNSQHQPAPEGTVKELAAKYGKSLGVIRKLKAAGLLHTLETADQ